MDQYSSHMSAAASGCFLCKELFDSTKAERTDNGWKNSCASPGCSGTIEYTVSYDHKVTEKQPVKKLEDIKEFVPNPSVCTNWVFVANMYEWMDKDGNVVSIRKITDKEFADSVWAIVHTNFTKVGSTLSWVKQLVLSGAPYAYPKETLRVGTDYAKEKLEEFYEIGVEKGLVTPRCD